MAVNARQISFPGSRGANLAARLDFPTGEPRAFALFAHCFTCSKDILAASRIAAGLSERGIAVLRFDFTGLGQSEGEFANTDFSSNVGDLIRAADWLRHNHRAPEILIGHSLGGAAVLSAAGEIPEVTAVATLGAPAHADHVIHNFSANLDTIVTEGEATVSLAGRQFRIRKSFIDDLRSQTLLERVARLGRALMILHAPLDQTVGIENAGEIFSAAKHPKSFVSLDQADHLITRRADADYAAAVIAAWAERYVGSPAKTATAGDPPVVRVAETRLGTFQNAVSIGGHNLLADEPEHVGGGDTGPTPYDFLSTALGACTAMTLRMYAERKNLPLERVSVEIRHHKVHADDCAGCAAEVKARAGKIDRFERSIGLEGALDTDTRARLIEIAGRCPVHRTLEAGAAVVTREAE